MQASQTSTTPLRWFGSSGIRGPLDAVDPTLALRLGRALGAQYRRIVVGHDARVSGPALGDALVAGLLASGAHVTRAGLLPTPALAFFARGYDLGVQVTASHNPAPDNGFKLWLPNGAAPGDDVLRRIEAAMDVLPPLAKWDATGTEAHSWAAARRYSDAILHHVREGSGTTPLDGHRIALDCAHGAGGAVTPRLLSRLGAQTTVLGAAPDGRFPDHPSEPNATHLHRLSHLMATGDHLIGIAHDGDADRTVFLAPDGTLLAPERVLAVVAEARGDEQIALPVDASGVVQDHLPDARIQITPVGDIHLSRAIGAGTATIGCEPSGTWFFGDWSPTPEGPFAAAYIGTLFATRPALIDAIAALPEYARVTHKVPLPAGSDRSFAHQVSRQAGARLEQSLDPVAVSRVDGLRLDTDDGWVLVRPSGTEPLLRVTAEAQQEGRARTLADAAQRLLADALQEAA